MSQKLWVQHQTTAKTYGPTKVPIDGCADIDDFLKEIKKEFEIPGPASQLTLYQPDGKTKIKPTANFKSLQDAGKDGDIPLIVKTTAPLTQSQPTALFSHCHILGKIKGCSSLGSRYIYCSVHRFVRMLRISSSPEYNCSKEGTRSQAQNKRSSSLLPGESSDCRIVWIYFRALRY